MEPRERRQQAQDRPHRRRRPYVSLLRDCCGKPPTWIGDGLERRVTCTICGRVSAPDTQQGSAARDWNFRLKREKACVNGHPDPIWIVEPSTGKRRCKACRVEGRLRPVHVDPSVTATTQARVGYALDAALRAAKVTISDAVVLSGIRRIGKIRNGEDNPTVETLARIADAIGMDMWVTFVGRKRQTEGEAMVPGDPTASPTEMSEV